MKFIEKRVSMDGKTYKMTVLEDNAPRFYVHTLDYKWRLLHTAPIIARIIAAVVEQDHAEALEINAAMSAVTPEQEKAAEILEDVARRVALFGFAGQAVKFSMLDHPRAFGVHFQTAGGEDIGGYAYFRDVQEVRAVADVLRASLASGVQVRSVLLRTEEAA